LVSPGQPALSAIIAEFGADVIDPQGELRRGHLRALIFSDPEKRKRLEQILHPRIYAEMERRARSIKSPYLILCIPLLLETGGASRVDRVLVVDAPEELQKQRVAARDGVSPDAVEAMLITQLSRKQRLRQADVVIENQGNIENLRRQVLTLHQHFLSLTGASANVDGRRA
jgi:dephospho-CoA kinase